jgi:hypothetical protein
MHIAIGTLLREPPTARRGSAERGGSPRAGFEAEAHEQFPSLAA